MTDVKLLGAPIAEDPTCQACEAGTRLEWRNTKHLEHCECCGQLYLNVQLTCPACGTVYAHTKVPLPRGIQA